MKTNYIPPHTVKSRDCIEKDTQRIIEDGLVMYDMCDNPPENHGTAFAVAHAQITDNDPLRFFVTEHGEIIINPVITNHTKHTVEKPEGCVTFPVTKPGRITERYNKCEVEYYTIEDTETLEWVKKTESVSGKRAQIFQHEIDHFNAKYLYN